MRYEGVSLQNVGNALCFGAGFLPLTHKAFTSKRVKIYKIYMASVRRNIGIYT